jgi:hypothetical protein
LQFDVLKIGFSMGGKLLFGVPKSAKQIIVDVACPVSGFV